MSTASDPYSLSSSSAVISEAGEEGCDVKKLEVGGEGQGMEYGV